MKSQIYQNYWELQVLKLGAVRLPSYKQSELTRAHVLQHDSVSSLLLRLV
ncbi:Uncharacterised protein [Vibrio cholerae]|nr:Uncharacterised protein [Vibrio cholerae]